jgi:hypothetical protein
MNLTLELSEKVLNKLKEKADREDAITNDIVVDAIIAYLDLSDPESKQEVRLKLSEKYLRESDEFLAEGDYIQASEKAWGAAAQMVKLAAMKKGFELCSHSELHKFVVKLAKEANDNEIRRLWQSAGMLHQNFYENWLPEEMVAGNIEDVKELVKRAAQHLTPSMVVILPDSVVGIVTEEGGMLCHAATIARERIIVGRRSREPLPMSYKRG